MTGFVSPLAALDDGLHALAGRSDAFDGLTRLIANDLLFVAVLVAIAAVWRSRDAARVAATVVGGAALALAIGQVIGLAWARSRPFQAEHFQPLMAHGTDPSFPSDHLLAAGVITSAVWMVHRRAALAVAVMAALVGAARCVAGVHYISDVVAGFVIGVAAAAIVWRFLQPVAGLLYALDQRAIAMHLRPGVQRDSNAPRSSATPGAAPQ